MKYGFVGLGNMGFGMAMNVLKKEGELLVWNRSRGKIERAVALGATAAGSAQEMAQVCDAILVSLPGPKEVQQVVGQELIPNGHAGQYLIDTSTVDPATSREMYKLAAEKGIRYFDCPVSGGKAGADAGTLTFMIGGTEEELKPVATALEAMGKLHHYMGTIGGGAAIKVINNYMSFSSAIIDAEAVVMAEKAGIALDRFMKVVLSSSGANAYLKSKESKILSGDLEAAFTIKLVLKDLELAYDLAKSFGISDFMGSEATMFFRLAAQSGYADKDSSAVVALFRKLTQGGERDLPAVN